MRLGREEHNAIIAAAAETLPGATVRLFGSRAFDHLRGGDTDLLIEWDGGDEWSAEGAFRHALFLRVEPRAVDVLFIIRGTEPTPIQAIALRDGIIL